jgi:hypothetical protein
MDCTVDCVPRDAGRAFCVPVVVAEVVGMIKGVGASGGCIGESVTLGVPNVGVKAAALGFKGEGTAGLYDWKLFVPGEAKNGFDGVLGPVVEA